VAPVWLNFIDVLVNASEMTFSLAPEQKRASHTCRTGLSPSLQATNSQWQTPPALLPFETSACTGDGSELP